MINTKTVVMLAVIVLLVVLLILPDRDNSFKEVGVQQIHNELNQNTHFFTTDEIANLLINEDPSLLLIDIRKEEDFLNYSLPGAMNLPIENLLEEDNLAYFDQDFNPIVLYGNATVIADQAWMLLRRLGYKNIFVMKGGLNEWVETILRPTLPSTAEADDEEMEKYLFRKSASQYFGKGGAQEETEVKAPKPVVKKRKVETEVAGGC
jgi:rhodanese-related sulfurtransferase